MPTEAHWNARTDLENLDIEIIHSKGGGKARELFQCAQIGNQIEFGGAKQLKITGRSSSLRLKQWTVAWFEISGRKSMKTRQH